MVIRSLKLKNFRNYSEETFEFSDGVNIISGANAQGKTNCAEAIFYLCTGYSPRAGRDKQLIMAGADKGFVEGEAVSAFGKINVNIAFFRDKNKEIKINGVPVAKVGELLGNVNSVFFNPAELKLIQEAPEDRRRFLDYAISQLDSSYLRAQQTYTRALMQRNKLLLTLDSMGKSGENMLDIWDKKLAEAGGIISKKRAEYTESVNRYACGFFSDMTSGAERPCFEYRDERDEENILRLLHSVRERDIKLRTTSAGPHKDDISITLNGREARAYASQGQQRSLAVAMKLAEAGISGERTGEKPVLLLDDVLSELDEHRKKYILTSLRDGQIIISACEKDIFGQSSGNVINVKGGTFSCI